MPGSRLVLALAGFALAAGLPPPAHAEEGRGISTLNSQPFRLNTRDPDIKTVRDFSGRDKIALPAIKVSVQAGTLEMAAAQELGREKQTMKFARFMQEVGSIKTAPRSWQDLFFAEIHGLPGS